MTNRRAGITVLAALLMLHWLAPAAGAQGAAEAAETPLSATISALDGRVFDAFNRCADPAQLEIHASHFAADVEFYHDNGGVTWTRDAMLANTAANVCGKITRKLVPGSLKVYPVRDFGAIAQGVHVFCPWGSDDCEGMADFVMVWRQLDGRWQITRVLSYGHRTADAVP